MFQSEISKEKIRNAFPDSESFGRSLPDLKNSENGNILDNSEMVSKVLKNNSNVSVVTKKEEEKKEKIEIKLDSKKSQIKIIISHGNQIKIITL